MPSPRTDSRASTAMPLRLRTPAGWVGVAMTDPLALLEDHAHLERKAASNALELVVRWPERVELEAGCKAADRWAHVLASIAQDEMRHLAQVLRLLERRGGHMTRTHVNPYAAALRAEVRRGAGVRELHDRLLVSALIELRSFERFSLLAAGVDDPELATFYESLKKSEAGHYTAFLELAASLPEVGTETESRFDAWLDIEAGVASRQLPACRMHGGWDAQSRRADA